jgi:iron(III) transport system substrate-binding protein
VLQAWGPFNQAKVSAERLGELNAQALELMAANGWQ